MNNQTSQRYRIIYEAYSKFANGINRCGSLEEVVDDLQRHLKYLLNFHYLRLVLQQEEDFLLLSISGNDIHYDIFDKKSLLLHEIKLLEKGIPLKTSEIPREMFTDESKISELLNPELWGWSFEKNERYFVVSLIADENKPFASKDVEILKLVTDCLEAKFQEIFLKNQLAQKNESLSKAYSTIKEQNDQIQEIVENQKEIIKERTHEIIEKNEKLLHILALNAHNVREPLSRIQGIAQLFEFMDDKSCREELIPKLNTSAHEMDEVLKEVIDTASRELVNLKGENA
ncbi:histidine kinase [Salinimicrobium sp. GXAS 041]|uniref:histidine kinase n=1 Tax=Salinimicrobium sp. GXAS 041 TaxID=3400806 RepID=UPI003C75C6AF